MIADRMTRRAIRDPTRGWAYPAEKDAPPAWVSAVIGFPLS